MAGETIENTQSNKTIEHAFKMQNKLMSPMKISVKTKAHETQSKHTYS